MGCKLRQLCMLLLLAASALQAQSITGTILGTVRDSSGAVVPGATVTLSHDDTGARLLVQTDATGEFLAASALLRLK